MWKSIKTAPKDKLIDIWVKEEGEKISDGYRQSNCYYDSRDNRWCWHDGHGIYPHWIPTHWMQIPKPPKR